MGFLPDVRGWLRRQKEKHLPFKPVASGRSKPPQPEAIDEAIASVFTPQNFPEDTEDRLAERGRKWTALLLGFQRYGHFSMGNRVKVLEGGDACFPEMLAAIKSARRRVWLESYIFDSSCVAEVFFNELMSAASRGCSVVLLVDYIGSFGIPVDWVSRLETAGAEVVFFNPVLPASGGVGPISFRDHRKILICDEVGFCGGMNVHEEVVVDPLWTDKAAGKLRGRFYDVHAKLEGPCVAALADVLRDSLRETGVTPPDPMPLPSRIDGGVYVQILQSNVRQRRRTLQQVIERSINAADDCVYLTTAYFFPPGFLRRALQRVPGRGAQLSLLLSGTSDFYPLPGDLLAQTHFLRGFHKETQNYKELVNVHLYSRRHMHAKHMSVDGVFSTIGSFNFDLYSSRRNLEVGVSVFDRGVAKQLQAMHMAKIKESERDSLDDWTYRNPVARVACAIAYGCIRLSGRNVFDGFDCFQRKWLFRKAALTFQLEEQAAMFVASSMMWGID